MASCSMIPKFTTLFKNNSSSCIDHKNLIFKSYRWLICYSTRTESNTHHSNVVFFGTDNFSVASLKSLHKEKHLGHFQDLHVVTVPHKGVSTPVRNYCISEGIDFSEWPISRDTFKSKKFQLGIVVSFGHLIPRWIIESIPCGILNVHGSLLPRWRGAAPIIHAILNQDKMTGVTIMRIQPHRFDTGQILYQTVVPINGMKSLALTEQMSIQGADTLIHCIRNLDDYILNAKTQPSEGITKAPKIKAEDSQIIWEEMSSKFISAMFRAFDDYFPLWTTWHGTTIKLKDLVNIDYINTIEYVEEFDKNQLTYITSYDFIKQLSGKARLSENSIEGRMETYNNPGSIRFLKKQKVLRIKSRDGYVHFKSVLVEGKSVMSAVDFQNGFLSKVVKTKRYFY